MIATYGALVRYNAGQGDMMQNDIAPPGHVPPAAQPPFPAHPAPMKHAADPAPHGATSDDVARAHPAPPPPGAIGTLGFALIGGAIAAAIGLAVAVPLLRGQAKPAAARRRTPATPRAPKKPRTASTPGPKPGSKRIPKT